MSAKTEEEISNQMIIILELYTAKDWEALQVALEDLTALVNYMVKSK